MKPDWCPSGVWERALSIAAKVLRHLPDDYGDASFEVEQIARALLAERERALEEVIRLIDSGGYREGALYIETTSDDHDAITDAIRALKDKP